MVAAASQCIKAILATGSGAGVLQKLETSGESDEWSSYLIPFKPSRRRKVHRILVMQTLVFSMSSIQVYPNKAYTLYRSV